MTIRIVSGGQTGVDRAALDVALDHGIPCGGWCPRERQAEDGRIDGKYPLEEVNGGYRIRTEKNVRDSDATLILICGELSGGTLLTRNLCKKHKKPHRIIDMDAAPINEDLQTWLRSHDVQTLNIAGPRESNHPGIYSQSVALLRGLFVENSES